jgi:hypothetical protein
MFNAAHIHSLFISILLKIFFIDSVTEVRNVKLLQQATVFIYKWLENKNKWTEEKRNIRWICVENVSILYNFYFQNVSPIKEDPERNELQHVTAQTKSQIFWAAR